MLTIEIKPRTWGFCGGYDIHNNHQGRKPEYADSRLIDVPDDLFPSEVLDGDYDLGFLMEVIEGFSKSDVSNLKVEYDLEGTRKRNDQISYHHRPKSNHPHSDPTFYSCILITGEIEYIKDGSEPVGFYRPHLFVLDKSLRGFFYLNQNGSIINDRNSTYWINKLHIEVHAFTEEGFYLGRISDKLILIKLKLIEVKKDKLYQSQKSR